MDDELAIGRLEAENDRLWSRLSLGGYYYEEDREEDDDPLFGYQECE